MAEGRPLTLALRQIRLIPLEEVALAGDRGDAAVVGDGGRRVEPAAGHLREAGDVEAGQPVVGVQQAEPGAGEDLVGFAGHDLGDVRRGEELEVVGDPREGRQRRSGGRVVGADQVVVGSVLADQQQVGRVANRQPVLDDRRVAAARQQLPDRGRLEEVDRAGAVGGVGTGAVDALLDPRRD